MHPTYFSDNKINERYDCLECNKLASVSVKNGKGTCLTPGCLQDTPIQFVYFPHWPKPKASRQGRPFFPFMNDFDP
ncbi:hypothetical protein EDC32_102364 [Laceyella sacchari]|nr:hypothetical protein EDC32_102364 [Laceyella sacchari]